jgi:hypothetical protein
MDFQFTLEKEQVKALIEMIEKNRCEGEDKICSQVRTSIKKQYQSQYIESKNTESTTQEDILEHSKAAFGQTFCDNCD